MNIGPHAVQRGGPVTNSDFLIERLSEPPPLRQIAAPLEVLEARAWVRAYLWGYCDILDLIDALDPLQDYAEVNGLVERLGQDAIQQIIHNAFRPWRAFDA